MRFIISFFILVLCSCSNAQESFPDNVTVKKTDNLRRIKGTRFFSSAPASYTPIESMARMQKDDNTYFQVAEIPNSNFLEAKGSFTKEAIESKGAKVDIVKPVKYLGYDAVFVSGPSKKPGETKLGIYFGDQDFVVMVVCVCKTADKKGYEELQKIISTSYYDKSFDLDPMETATFTFDQSITGFKYATRMGNFFIYTPDGKSDLKNQEETPSFQLATIEALDISKAKEFVDYTISRYHLQGIQASNIIRKDITIDNNPAYEVTMEIKDKENKKALAYQVIIHKGTTAVLFMASDPEQGKWMEKYKATAKTIKM